MGHWGSIVRLELAVKERVLEHVGAVVVQVGVLFSRELTYPDAGIDSRVTRQDSSRSRTLARNTPCHPRAFVHDDRSVRLKPDTTYD